MLKLTWESIHRLVGTKMKITKEVMFILFLRSLDHWSGFYSQGQGCCKYGHLYFWVHPILLEER